VRPFFENADVKKTIEELLKLLDYTGTDPDQLKKRQEFQNEVMQWQKYPFDPHLIARNRITPYQKTVVMKYIDNLIAWGDQLFGQDTIEAINEATQLYILATQILGDRPQDIPPHFTVPAHTYNQLEPELDGFSNRLVQVENLLPPPATDRLLPNPAFGLKPPVFKPSVYCQLFRTPALPHEKILPRQLLSPHASHALLISFLPQGITFFYPLP